jgi:hypothetical protein
MNDYIKSDYNEFIAYKISSGSTIHYIQNAQSYYLFLANEGFKLTATLNKSEPKSTDQIDFETSHLSTANKKVSTQQAFASKTIGPKKLYKRVHGIKSSLSIGLNSTTFVTPHPECKITGVEVIGGSIGDTVNFKILDTATGTVSTIPNYMLNQFGFNVNVCAGSYEHKSEYEADLFQGLQILVEYSSVDAKSVGFNFILNEVK